jgi:S-methylmethionine-dependent homocysteine/selenocysteine methylase
MPRYRHSVPQLSGDIFLADAGVETDLIFNNGIELRELAKHALMPIPEGRSALSRSFEGFLSLANQQNASFILDTVTWKAHRHWADRLGATDDELKAANEDNVRFIAELCARYSGNAKPIVLNAVIGPRGDAYEPEAVISMDSPGQYYA